MSPKIALVTGSGRKFGAKIAQTLAARGFVVIVHAHASRVDAEHVVDEIIKSGGKAYAFFGDLTAPSVIDDLIKSVEQRSAHLDVLVNNASYFEYDFPGKGDIRALRNSLEIHVCAPFILIEHFSKTANGERNLDVFNLLDQKLLAMNPDYMSYTIGKAALQALTEIWQVSPRRHTRVFGIMPGNMYPSGPQSTEDFENAGRGNLLGRNAMPQEVCEAISFFLDNRGLPAQNLAVDAGEHLALRTRDPAYDGEIRRTKVT